MRKLKITLADGNVYTFSTLTIKEQTIARKIERLSQEEQLEMDTLIAKTSENKELTSEEDARMDAIQSKQIRSMLKILLIAISKFHEEFRAKTQEAIEQAYDKLETLIDLRDMKRLTSFTLMGSLPREEVEESFEYEETIDLTDKSPSKK